MANELPTFGETLVVEFPDGRKYMTTGVLHNNEFRIETLCINPDNSEETVNTQVISVLRSHTNAVSNHQGSIAARLAGIKYEADRRARNDAALAALREKLTGDGSANIL